jgi:RNA polymerase sigma-70 factor, ECF subfamily
MAALVAAHGSFVARQLRRCRVPESVLDDAVQQVFLVAQRKVDRVEEGRERAFLAGVVLNVAAHARRRLARRREVHDEEGVAALADEALLPDEALDAARARVFAEEALGGLDDDLRAVVVAFELEGRTMAAIADELGIPIGTVASRLRRAREAMVRHAQRRRFRSGPVPRPDAGVAAQEPQRMPSPPAPRVAPVRREGTRSRRGG